MSPFLILLLDTTCKPWSIVTNTILLTQYFFGHSLWNSRGIIDCCKYCHLPSHFPSTIESSMTIFHQKLLTREGRVVANGWTHPWQPLFTYSLVVSSKSYHSGIKYHTMTLHIIFSVFIFQIFYLHSNNTIFWFKSAWHYVPRTRLL